MTSCSRPKHRSTRLEFSAKGWYSTDGSSVGNKDFKVSVERLLLNGGQTLYMVGIALLIGTVIGTLLALVLVPAARAALWKIKFYTVSSASTSMWYGVFRSSFAGYHHAAYPRHSGYDDWQHGRFGSVSGPAFSPYLACLIENSLLEVSPGILGGGPRAGSQPADHPLFSDAAQALPPMVLALNAGTVGLLGACHGWLLRRRRYRDLALT